MHRRRLSKALKLPVLVEDHCVGPHRDVVEQQVAEAQRFLDDVADAGRNDQQRHLPIRLALVKRSNGKEKLVVAIAKSAAI